MRNILFILLLFLTSCSVNKFYFSSIGIAAYESESNTYYVGKTIDESDGKIKIKNDRILFKNNEWTLNIKILRKDFDDSFTIYQGILPDGNSCELQISEELKLLFLYLFYDNEIKKYEGLIIINDLSDEKK